MKQLKLAGCILVDESKRMLLLHRNKNGISHWELPGGKIDAGEEAAETAVRELAEELGVEVEIVKDLGNADFTADDTICTYHWFLAKIVVGTPQICEPQTFDDLRYVSLGETSGLVLSANMQNIRDALKSGRIEL